MSFYHRYELVHLVAQGNPRSFQARDNQSGRLVLLHLWPAGEEGRAAPLLLRIRDQMRTDPAALIGTVIELQDRADPPYLITVFDEQFATLGEWLESRMGQPAPPPPQQAAGEFTRMFSPTAPEEKAAPEAAPAPPPGEFTRLFTAASPPPPTLPEKPAPGLIAVPPSPPPPASERSGEFTRFFGSPYAAHPLPVEQLERGTVAPPPPPPAEKPFQGPSDFTIQFGSQKSGAPAAPPPAHSPLDAPATGLFARPEYAAPEPLLPAETPAGPSEFTRVIRGFDPQAGDAPLSGATQSAPPPGGAVAPPPARSRSNSLLLGVLSAAVVILILAIVVLLTR
ncbi:MAG: hypothetical protein MUC42_03220 [Bryobacter sp.]|nr:hypothetical protein [Bryobacter sp.]